MYRYIVHIAPASLKVAAQFHSLAFRRFQDTRKFREAEKDAIRDFIERRERAVGRS